MSMMSLLVSAFTILVILGIIAFFVVSLVLYKSCPPENAELKKRRKTMLTVSIVLFSVMAVFLIILTALVIMLSVAVAQM